MSRSYEYLRIVLPRQAERLLRDEGLLSLPVDLEELAKRREIVVKPMPNADDGVSGMLVRHGNTFGILYSIRIDNVGFRRFSVAHELGHYFIDGHLDHVGDSHASHAGLFSTQRDRYEREADFFAAGLLMPEALVRDVVSQEQEGLAAVRAVQRQAQASLTAAAIRYVNLTEIAAAVIVSRNNTVEYCFMSEAMKASKPEEWPRKGTRVPPDTTTRSIENLPQERRRHAQSDEIDITEWLGGNRSAHAREEVVGLGKSGRVLTVLTCPELPDEDFPDEDSEEELVESWTPRFRR